MAANFYMTMDLGDERHEIVAADGGSLAGSEHVLVVVDDSEVTTADQLITILHRIAEYVRENDYPPAS